MNNISNSFPELKKKFSLLDNIEGKQLQDQVAYPIRDQNRRNVNEVDQCYQKVESAHIDFDFDIQDTPTIHIENEQSIFPELAFSS